MTTFNISALCEELERLYKQAQANGLDAASARAFASGCAHDQLAAIVRKWQDMKTDEATA